MIYLLVVDYTLHLLMQARKVIELAIVVSNAFTVWLLL